jgi:hypothetical protein
VSQYKPKEGECTIRLMPAGWGSDKKMVDKWGAAWKIAIYVHWGVGPDKGAYLCLDKMKGEPCPVCEAQREAEDEDERQQFKPSARALCWLIDRDNERAGPQVWSMPNTFFRDLSNRSIDKKSNSVIRFDSPAEGYDVVFTREGSGLKTKYESIEVLRDSTPLNDDPKKQEAWLEYISSLPLPEVLNYYDGDYIEKVLYGRKKAAARDEEDTRKPRERQREEPDTEEEDRAPRRSAARGRADGDGVGDNEEEAPRRAVRASQAESEGAQRVRRSRADVAEQDADEADEAPPWKDDAPDEKDLPLARTARRSLERLRDRVKE